MKTSNIYRNLNGDGCRVQVRIYKMKSGFSTVCSGPLRLVDPDQLLLDFSGGVDQFVEPPECHRFLLFSV